MTDTLVLAYLAGAIDADGHITITRSFRTKGKHYTHAPKKPNHKPVHIWAVGTADAGRIAAALLPFLRLKKRQAEVLIHLCDLITKQHAEQKATQKPPYRITEEQLAARERLWVEVTKLNQPRNRRVHHLDDAAGRLLDGVRHDGYPV